MEEDGVRDRVWEVVVADTSDRNERTFLYTCPTPLLSSSHFTIGLSRKKDSTSRNQVIVSGEKVLFFLG
jgi:hypothetical protein